MFSNSITVELTLFTGGRNVARVLCSSRKYLNAMLIRTLECFLMIIFHFVSIKHNAIGDEKLCVLLKSSGIACGSDARAISMGLARLYYCKIIHKSTCTGFSANVYKGTCNAWVGKIKRMKTIRLEKKNDHPLQWFHTTKPVGTLSSWLVILIINKLFQCNILVTSIYR